MKLRDRVLQMKPPVVDCRIYRLYEYPKVPHEDPEIGCTWGEPILV